MRTEVRSVSFVAGVVLAMGSLTAIASSEDPKAGWVAAQSPALLDWVRQRAVPLRTIGLDGEDADLDAVATLIAPGTRVIGFGEGPLHGMGEAMALRNRLFAYLVEHHGVTAYAAETSYTAGTRVDDYVTQGGELTEDILDFAYIAVPRSRSTAPTDAVRFYSRQLVDWMHEYNSRPGTRRPIRFYGIDSCPGSDCIGPAVDAALAYLRRVDPHAAQALDRRFKPLLSRAGIPVYGAAKTGPHATLRSTERDEFTAAIADLVSLFSSRRVTWIRETSSRDYHQAYRNAVVARQLDGRARDSASRSPSDDESVCGYENCRTRGAAMAENVLWALEREGPQGRIFLFEHLLHLDKAMPSIAGAHLREELGEQIRVIGLLGVEAINYGSARFTCPARSPSLVELLDRDGRALLFLDTRGMPAVQTAPRERGSSWCNRHIIGQWRVNDSYDGLIYLKPGSL